VFVSVCLSVCISRNKDYKKSDVVNDILLIKKKKFKVKLQDLQGYNYAIKTTQNVVLKNREKQTS
jgi:hypothetical protein